MFRFQPSIVTSFQNNHGFATINENELEELLNNVDSKITKNNNTHFNKTV